MALHGVDLSHHNSDSVFLKSMDEEDFIILKATEGKTYQDPCFNARQNVIIQKGIRRGYYHYARPENNSPEEEAENFLRIVGDDAKNALLALDWEGKALQYNFLSWGAKWIQCIRHRINGADPILYASASVIRALRSILEVNNIPVWTAHYDDDCANGCNHDGGIVDIMTQYTSSGVDRNIFHGNRWEDYTASGALVTVNEKEIVTTWMDENYQYEIARRKKEA